MEHIFERIRQERQKQDEKWGEQNHNAVEWIAILSEEVGEACKEAVNFHFNKPDNSVVQHSEGAQYMRIYRLKNELIQVAAVAVSIIQSIERQQ